jgi:hypothetical protein
MTDIVADIIAQALKASGVLGLGQVAQASDSSDALFQVNLILGQWNRKRWLNLDLVDVSFVGSGVISYSIGATGTIVTARPDRIESAFLRIPPTTFVDNVLTDGNYIPLTDGNGNVLTDGGALVAAAPSTWVDYPMYVVQAREEYNRIVLKGMTGWPRAVWYDSAYPLGNVYVWPVPTSAYEIHLALKVGIAQITDPTQPLLLPDEYSDALLWTLAARLRPMYQMPPDPTITAAMRAALNTIRVANTQIPAARMPAALASRNRGHVSDIAGFISGWTT